MKLTMPQIIMFGHASHCNYEKIKDGSGDKKSSRANSVDGSFLDKMSTEQRDAYYMDW